MSLLKEDLLVLLVLVLLLLLSGCSLDDYERQLAVQEHRDRFYRGCLPRKGDIVTAQWVKGELICQRITTSPRYGRSFPHAEVRVGEVL